MKKLFSVLVLFTVDLLFTSEKIEEDKFEFKKIEKSMTKISDNLHASKFEVANLEYRIFLNELKTNKPDDYKIAVVDSEQWQKKFAYAHHEPLVNNYFWHPAYNNYPVVNISYEGAEMFCKWLTEKYNSTSMRNFKKVKFRLPANEEWELAARGGRKGENYPFGNYLRDENGKYMCNYRPMGDEFISSNIDSKKFDVIIHSSVHVSQFMADGYTYTCNVNAFKPNGFGLYNMSGNVAEMVSEKGVARGGSWCNTGYDVRIESRMMYDKPSPLVGFRCFMEVLEK